MKVEAFSPEQSSIQVVTLDSAENTQLATAALDLHGLINGMSEPEGIAEIYRRAGEVDLDRLGPIGEILGDFATHATNVKVLVIQGPDPEPFLREPVTLDRIKTPQAHVSSKDNPVLVPDLFRELIMARYLPGHQPFGMDDQQDGEVRNNVVFIPEQADAVGTSASKKKLGLHIEEAAYILSVLESGLDRNISADLLSLLFLRNPHGGVPTTVSPLDMRAFEERYPEYYKVLREPFFQNKTNMARGEHSGLLLPKVSPIYGNDWVRLNMAANIDTEQYTQKQQRSLRALMRFATDSVVALPVAPGCIVLIDNRRAMHGRSEPKPGQVVPGDEFGRWQRRIVYALLEQIKPYLADPSNPHLVSTDKFLNEVFGHTG